MITKYEKANKGKLLAVAMVMVMLFAGAAVMAADSDVDAASNDTTYLSGQITSTQTFGAGTNVVVNGNLTVPENMSLIIGGKLAVNDGFTLTVQDGGKLIINGGASATFDGDLLLKNGAVMQNSAMADGTNTVNGSPVGLFINGNFSIEKGAVLSGVAISTTSGGSDSASGTDVTYNPIKPVGTNGEAIDETPKIALSGDVLYVYGTVPEHMNGAGKMGYWVGVKITVTNANVEEGDAVQLKIGDRASVPAETYDSNKSFNVWLNAAMGSQTISYAVGNDTKTLTIDMSNVKFSADNVRAGEIVIGSTGTFSSASTKTTPSVIVDQTINMVAGATVEIDSAVDNVTVSAYAADGIYTYGSVSLTTDATVYTYPDTVGSNLIAQDLTFGVVSEKISSAILTNGGEESTTTKASNLVLTVAGMVDSGYSMTVNCNTAIAGAYTTLTYPDTQDEKKSSGVNMTGIVRISETLNIGENGTLVVDSGANAEVVGTVNANGKTGATATMNLYGNLYVSGTVDIGSVTGNNIIANLNLKDAESNGAYLVIVGDGVVSVDDFDFSTAEVPAGTYGACYETKDTFFITSLSKAITDAVAADVSEVTLWAIDATVNQTGFKIMPMPYTLDADFTIPDGIELTINNTLVINKGVTLTIEEGAELAGDLALIDVNGTMVDYTLEERTYGTTAGAVIVDAEVRFIDADETYYMYTTLENALSGRTSGTVDLFGDASVDGALTIPTGVTVDFNGRTMNVKINSELIVDGTIDMTTAGSKLVIMNVKAGEQFDKDGKVTVNNMIVNPNVFTKVGDAGETAAATTIAGFYADGTIGDYENADFILSADVAAENSTVVSNIKQYGEITVGDLAFVAGEDNVATITVNGKLTVGTINVTGYSITIADDGVFNGTIASANGSVALKNVSGSSNASVVIANTIDTDEGTDKLVITGTPDVVNAEGSTTVVLDTTVDVVSGNVYVSGAAFTITNVKGFAIADNTTVTIETGGSINAGGNSTTLTVSGTLAINTTNGLSGITDLVVLGTVNVKEATAEDSTSGSASVTNAYVGMTINSISKDNKETASDSTATVTGNLTATGNAYVLSGVSVGESLTKDKKATAFYVDDVIWMTAYNNGAKITVDNAPLTNAILNGWIDPTVENATASMDVTVGTPERVDADIDYKIYTVVVTVDNGIGSVAIDGQVMLKGSISLDGVTLSNVFYLEGLTAGNHEITYQLKSGYEGTATMSIDGTAVSGYNITLSGTSPDDRGVLISLSGTTPIDYSQAGTSDDGMGIVEILLVILVVVVVILAIIVVLRMMRS